MLEGERVRERIVLARKSTGSQEQVCWWRGGVNVRYRAG